MDKRKQEEAEFHSRREKDRLALGDRDFLEKYSNKKWYSIARTSDEFLSLWIKNNCREKTVLDYCCGTGGVALRLAQHGAFVYGIDISEESVITSEKRLNESGFSGRSHFEVMDAEQMTFPADTFDAILCTGVLHHLDIQSAYRQLSRVLKPDGKILCLEALGYNPLINLYRRRTPHLRTSWEAEHILTLREINLAGEYFGTVRTTYFHLFTIAGVLFRRSRFFKGILCLLEKIDSVILRVPYLNRLAWQVAFELALPRK